MPTDPPSSPTSFDCPHCQAPVPGYDLSESSYFACVHCRTYFHYGDSGPKEIITAFDQMPSTPPLSIGAEGYLDGKWVRVTGIIRKRETQYEDSWMEYVLMTQDGVHQMLAEYNGHWMVIQPVKETYTEDKGQNILENDQVYSLYNRYNCMVLNAAGEFYWNILDDFKLTISEYIHPPYMLSRETDGSKTEWFKATYKTPKEIATAFGISDQTLPKPVGVGAIQPSPAGQKMPSVGWLATRLALVVVAVQVLLFVLNPQKTLFNHEYFWNPDSTRQSRSEPIVSSSFTIDGPAAVEVDLDVTVDNNWLELPISLVNEESGQTYEFTRIVEYYHGYEDGESWSEGTQDDEAILSRIPGGKYHLNLYPASEGRNEVKFRIKVIQNPVLYSNLFLMLVLIGIYPLIVFIQTRAFEQKRWADSDSGP